MEQLIYDRTKQDAEYALSHMDDIQYLKGAHNYIDLNRVEKWCRYLANELKKAGYDIEVSTKIDWKMTDVQTYVAYERIRTNIKKITDGYKSITQVYNNVDNFNYLKANNWEQILNEINTIMSNMQGWYVYSGVANCGQNRLWQNIFRNSYIYDFDSAQNPTSWEKYSDTEFRASNSFGEWIVTSTGNYNTTYTPERAFDSDTGTYWRTIDIQDDNSTETLTLELPCGIKPKSIKLRVARIGANSVIKGFNQSLNTWETLAEVKTTSAGIVNLTYPINTEIFYDKIAFEIHRYSETYKSAYVYNVDINSGEMKG